MMQHSTISLISVVYVNWNTCTLLLDSLQSLLEHAGNQALDIIVVDNGSDDGSVETVRQRFPAVNVIALDENTGFAVGNNIGAAQARGDMLLLLNTDTVVLATTLPGLLSRLHSSATIGCVGARHRNEDMSLQRSMDSFPNIVADFLSLTELHRLGPVARYLSKRHAWWSDHDTVRSVDWVNGACMLFRVEAFNACEGFDRDFFIYGEEIDLCRRLRDKGWDIQFTPEAEIVHLGGRAMDHIAAERLLLNYQGLLRFYDRHKSGLSRIMIRLVIFLTITARFFLSALLYVPSQLSQTLHSLMSDITQVKRETPLMALLKTWGRILIALTRSHRKVSA